MVRDRISQDDPHYRQHLGKRREAFDQGDREMVFDLTDDVRPLYAARHFYDGLVNHREGHQIHEGAEDVFTDEIVSGHADAVREMLNDRGVLKKRIAIMLTSDRSYMRELASRDIVGKDSLLKALKSDLYRFGAARWDTRWSDNRLDRSRELLEIFDDASDELILELTTHAMEIVEQRREQVERVFPEMKKRFLDRIKPMIVSRRYPMTFETAKARIEDLSVTVGFPLGLEAGFIDGEQTGIFIDVFEVNEGDVEGVIMHELMHALSGSTIHVRRNEQEKAKEYEVSQVGLRTNPNETTWLNEAVTELETMRILGREYGAYPAERQLFKALQLGGKYLVPDRVFLDAYFFSSGDYEEDIISFDLLKSRVDASYRQGFFDRFIEAVQVFPVDQMIEILETDWRRLYTVEWPTKDAA